MAERLKGCRRIIISEENLKLLGIRYSYVDYERFFERSFAPLRVSDESLLDIPETIEQPENGEDGADEDGEGAGSDNDGTGARNADELFDGIGLPPNNNNNEPPADGFDFDEDFYR